MKKYILIIILLPTVLVAQVTVSTLTPQFKGSGGLSLDDDGNLYIADFGDFLSAGDGDGQPNNVWQLDTDLNLTVYSGDFVGASGNAFDSNGVLFQSDIADGAIYKIVNNSRVFVTNTGINQPVGITFDSQGNFFVCNCGNSTIRKVTPGGASTLFSSSSLLFCPNGLTIDEDDNLYVSNFSNGNIVKITPTGNATLVNATPGGTTSGPSNGHLDYHEPTNTLYIASHGANRIYSIDLDNPSVLNTIAGSGIRGNSDGGAQTATFSRPNGVAVTQTGDSIYINSAIPVTNEPNRPLNPQVIRLLKGVQGTLSVETIENSVFDVQVIPNPVTDKVSISANSFEYFSDLQVVFYNLDGKIIRRVPVDQGNDNQMVIETDLADLPSGVYLFAIKTQDRNLYNGRIIKN